MGQYIKTLYFVIFLMMLANFSKADICGPEFDQQKPAKTSIEIDAAQTDDEKSVFIYFDQSLNLMPIEIKLLQRFAIGLNPYDL